MIKNAPNIFSSYLFKPKVLQDLRRTGPISQSQLWNVMRKYYIEKGPDAWASKDVPIERTNNSLIAQRYAHSIAAFLRDVAENAKQNNQEAPTVDIVELECGAGRLGFYLMVALAKLVTTSDKNHCPYRFILMDLSPKNIQAIKLRKEFIPYIQSGVLDVALYDAERGGSFSWNCQKINLAGSRRPLYLLLLIICLIPLRLMAFVPIKELWRRLIFTLLQKIING
jgi:hypothetical protein